MASGRRRLLRSRGARIAAGVVAAAAFGATWLYFAPTQLGGGATYSITDGISMEPLLHKNALAIVRAQPAYKVGDVVLYQSSTIHRPVLHRIVVIQNGHYFFQGDNNNFVDPGYATPGELTGKLWLHVPAVGGAVGWIGKPSHAGLLAGLTVLLLLAGGLRAGRRRRGRRRGPQIPAAGPRPRVHARRYLMPVGRVTLTALVVLGALGTVLVAVGFTSSSKRIVPLQDAYRHTGAFGYRAVTKPSLAYPSGVAVTGDPLFTSLVDTTTLSFKYRFVSALPHQIHGTIALEGLILDQSSNWKSLYSVVAKTRFTGDRAEAAGVVQLKELYTLLNQVGAASGVAGGSYTIDIQPVVHIVGTVGGTFVDTTFSSSVPFSVTAAVVALDVAPAAAPPGATYVPESSHAALDSVVKPVQSGSIPVQAANLVTVARYAVPVSAFRVLGPVLLVLALLIGVLHDVLLRRHSRLPEEEQIAIHLGCFVAPVSDLALPAGTAPTLVGDFPSLARLARYLERPILRQSNASGRTYAVDDETRVYQYRAGPAAPAAHAELGAGVACAGGAPARPEAASAPCPDRRRGARPRRRGHARDELHRVDQRADEQRRHVRPGVADQPADACGVQLAPADEARGGERELLDLGQPRAHRRQRRRRDHHRHRRPQLHRRRRGQRHCQGPVLRRLHRRPDERGELQEVHQGKLSSSAAGADLYVLWPTRCSSSRATTRSRKRPLSRTTSASLVRSKANRSPPRRLASSAPDGAPKTCHRESGSAAAISASSCDVS